MIRGIDVSHHQGEIDWKKVTQSEYGIQFAICKATQGASHVDEMFGPNIIGAKEAGLTVGAYHFFDPAADSSEQAKNFISQIKDADFPLMVALDLEDIAGWDAVDAEARAVMVQNFLDLVQTEFHGIPLVYTYGAFADKYLTAVPLGYYPLWLAKYAPTVPKGWQNYAIWQYSEKAQVDGIIGTVDLDRFEGEAQDLMKLTVSK